MSRSQNWFVLFTFCAALLLIGTALLLRLSAGALFVVQLVLLLVGAALFMAGFVNFAMGRGRMFFFAGFLAFVVGEVVLLLGGRSVEVVAPFLLVALVGFFASMPPASRSMKPVMASVSDEPHSMVFDSPMPKPVEEVKTTLVKSKTNSSAKVKTAQYSPGKYVASKQSNQYHEPKCDWALKISEGRRVWFKDKEEAWEQGYKAHSCVSTK